MCGIFGWVSNQCDKYSIESFKEKLYHRGPDEFNTININSNVLFGHTRLAINDLSSLGSQPMIDKISKNAIIFNGEIYNFKYLREELLSLGIKFEGNSDTEVLLKGYSFWGKSILDRIVGMFSFVIWDANEKLLFIARDRLGEKPFYFSNLTNGDFVFSSELKPLKLMDGFNDEIDPSFLTEYLSYGYTSTNQCIYKNAQKLKPAHYLIVKDGKIREEVEYWKLSEFFNNKKKYKSIDAAADVFINLLNDSIEGQLISDVSLGGLLSGGVDSGIVVSAMMQQNKKTNSFCAGFKEQDFDESNQAYNIANKIGTKHHSFDIYAPSFQEIIEPMKKCDEPFSDTSMIPTYFLSKYTREHVTVALTGDGGDELFGGYPTYTADIIYKLTSFLPRAFFRLLEKLIVFLPSSHKKVGFDYRIKALIKGLQFSYPKAHQSWRRLFFDDEISKLINGDNLKSGVENFQTISTNNFWKDVKDCHYLDQSMYVDIKTWLIDDILYKVDRMSMAHSLELRAPLLDHRIVEFAASLPVKFKKDIFKSKKLLKYVAKNFYGLNYNSQKKKGFNAPMSRWINLHQKDFSDYLVNCRLFNKEEVERLIDNHINKKQDNSFKISCLTSYAAWMESNNF
jgi:asparagine synthase (glutamine-hydrolysing)